MREYEAKWLKARINLGELARLRDSGVHLISKADVLELRSLIHGFLMNFRKKAEDSPEETVVALSLDYLVL